MAKAGANPEAGISARKFQAFQRAELVGHAMVHDQRHLFIAPIENISGGGLFIQNLVSILTGAEVRVVIKSAVLHETIQATGKVVRVEKNDRRGLAIEFTSISGKSRGLIQNAVQEARLEAELKVA